MATDRYTVVIDTVGAEKSLGSLTSKVGGMKTALAGAFVVAGIGAFVKEMIDVGKAYDVMRNQLKLVTSGQEDLNNVFEKLQGVSNRTVSELTATVELYGKLKLSTEALGKSSDDVIIVTEKFQKALALSGADAATASGAIRQFGQAMASGTVRGDEFNSIVEALGPALAIMARESGMTVGQLRELSRNGELTAEVFFEMVKGAESLDAVFSGLDLTTEQLQNRMSGTFSEILMVLNEATGAGETYKNVMISITQSLSDFFGTSQSLAELSPADIFKQVESGAINAQVALVELNNRYYDLMGVTSAFGLLNSEQRDSLKATADSIREMTAAREEEMNAAQASLEVDKEQQAARKEMLKPLTEMGAQLAIITKAYEKNIPQQEKMTSEYESVQATLTELLAIKDEEIRQTPEYEAALKVTQDRLAQLRLELDGTTKSTKDASREMKKLTETTADMITSLKDSTSDMQFDFDKLNMDPLQAQMADIEHDINTKIKKQILELEEAMTPENAAEITRQIDALKDAAGEAISAQATLAEKSYEYQRSFSYGWNKAFQEYRDDATNAANAARDIFQSTTSSINSAIDTFVDTGKLSLSGLLEDIAKTAAKTMLKAGVNNLLSGIMGGTQPTQTQPQQQQQSGGGITGFIKNIFGGMFANGGYLPAGKFGIAGENGPELITGPASITPGAARSGAVNLVINAVDAISFKQLVARDPEFIYSVAQRGARSFR